MTVPPPPGSTSGAALGPDGRTLTLGALTLRRLVDDDAEALFAALDHDAVWADGYGGGPAGRPRDAAAMAHRMTAWAKDRDGGVGYAVTHTSTGEVLGTTSLGQVDTHHRNLEIGWTAYAPVVWGTGVNAAAKLLLLGHAFDDCGMERVVLRIDSRNKRSAAAVARLGAHLDGVMRRDRLRPDGIWRDSLTYSILRDEWPGVARGLRERLPAT